MDQQTLELVSVLADVAGQLTHVSTFEQLAATALQIIERVVSVEYAGFFLRDQETQQLRLMADKGFTPEERAEAERTADSRHPGWVVRNAQLLHVPDVEADPEGRTQGSPGRRLRIRSRLFVPVLSDVGCVGAYGLASTQPHAFSAAHIVMLRYAASVTGSTYDSVTYRKRLVRQLEALSAKQEELLLLSSPVIEVWERTLALPIIGRLDAERARYMAPRLLEKVVALRALRVILDFTGAEVLDEASVAELLRIVGAIELLGSRCVFSGVSPQLARRMAVEAQTLLRIESHGTLKQALAAHGHGAAPARGPLKAGH
ncbi:MAG: GAF domain-containing protein [Polyangia bacterium]